MEFPEATADTDLEAGEYAVKMLDDAGKVISNTSLGASFKLHQDPLWDPVTGFSGGTTIESNVSMISLRLVYPPETARIQFLKHDTVLLEIDPVSRTLRDMIRDVPDRAFERRAEEQRTALYNKIDAFEKMLAQKNTRGALKKLEEDIRDKVEKWVMEYTARPGEPLISKAKVLAQIDRIAGRLRTRIEATPLKEEETPPPTP